MGPIDLRKFNNASGADAALTVSTTTGEKLRLLSVTIHYSNNPTHSGVTVTLDSGLGAAYDTVLLAGDANAQDTVLLPTSDLIIDETDAFKVTAPAGGDGITSAIEIKCERVY